MSVTYVDKLARVGESPRMRPMGASDHPNAVKLKSAHEAFQKGDLDALFSILAEDCVWHMPGDNVLSGDFRGRAQIMESFGRLQQNVDSYWAYPLDYFGSDDHVVLVAHVRATRGDKTLEVGEVLLWRVNDEGRLAEVWHVALDHKKWDEFFT